MLRRRTPNGRCDDPGVVLDGPIFVDRDEAMRDPPPFVEATLYLEVGVGLTSMGDIEPTGHH